MDLPPDIPIDPECPPDTLPELPPGYTWGLTVTAEAEVVKANNENEVTPWP